MKPLTVYAKKDAHGVAIFRDASAKLPFCRFSRDCHSKLPDRRNKRLTLNCYRWRVRWI